MKRFCPVIPGYLSSVCYLSGGAEMGLLPRFPVQRGLDNEFLAGVSLL